MSQSRQLDISFSVVQGEENHINRLFPTPVFKLQKGLTTPNFVTQLIPYFLKLMKRMMFEMKIILKMQ